MKILLITDAWEPQVNGVVRTLGKVVSGCRDRGHKVEIIHPGLFHNIPCPSYPEIPLAININKVPKLIRDAKADAIHIATEGPIGAAARTWLAAKKIPFVTSFHTRFPEYISERYPIPLWMSYAYFRWFHKPSKGILVPTPSMKQELDSRNFENVKVWARGVEHSLFHPDYPDVYEGLERPIYLNVGRVSPEKNLDQFLKWNPDQGTVVLVGGGPSLEEYKKKYPHVEYRGYRKGQELAAHFASADVFVFPSLSDTFGLVNIEAMACGLPVVAYNVTGPKDIIRESKTGYLMEPDLEWELPEYCNMALKSIKPEDCISLASEYTWDNCTEMFLDNLKDCLRYTNR